jgi:hypothetical protein
MPTQTVANRPFPDLEVLDSSTRGKVVEIDVTRLAKETLEETNDPLSAARGILLVLLLSTPFWIAVVYYLFW